MVISSQLCWKASSLNAMRSRMGDRDRKFPVHPGGREVYMGTSILLADGVEYPREKRPLSGKNLSQMT